MKFTAATLLGVALSATSTSAFVPAAQRTTAAFVPSTTSIHSTTEEATSEGRSMSQKKEDRIRFMKSDKFHRRGFKEVRDKVESEVGTDYESSLVGDIKSNNYVIEKDGVKVYLAKVRNR